MFPDSLFLPTNCPVERFPSARFKYMDISKEKGYQETPHIIITTPGLTLPNRISPPISY
jgi:hypothetical protein